MVTSMMDLPAAQSALLRQLEHWLAPKTKAGLEAMAAQSAGVTRKNFGRTMRLFAPLYLSNECVNNCTYCGFSRDNAIYRVTLTVDQVVKEARHLAGQGFRNLLLVAGEHPRHVPVPYLVECIQAIKGFIPTIAIEVAPMERPEYARLVEAGAEGLVVYQETYDRAAYAAHHTAGPKKDFDWRRACPWRGYEAGFRRLGIGVLFGLSDWRAEALELGRHLAELRLMGWKAAYTVAFPRLRPAAGGFAPTHSFTDRDLLQTICAFRLCFPDVGITLSTREPAALRDALLPLGITTLSAGSHTEPGGYTGQGQEDLHLTVKGRRVELTPAQKEPCFASATATAQFEISDDRPVPEVAAMLQRQGFEPVWKDWDEALLSGE